MDHFQTIMLTARPGDYIPKLITDGIALSRTYDDALVTIVANNIIIRVNGSSDPASIHGAYMLACRSKSRNLVGP